MNSIDQYRFVVLRAALKLEIAGMKRSRSPSAYSIIKREFGLRGNRQSVLDQFSTMYAYKVRDEVTENAGPSGQTG